MSKIFQYFVKFFLEYFITRLGGVMQGQEKVCFNGNPPTFVLIKIDHYWVCLSLKLGQGKKDDLELYALDSCWDS